MTPEEKAEELLSKYYLQVQTLAQQKQCALIAVDEIIQAIDFDWMEVQNLDREHAYWEQVKQEIEKL